jgi:cell division protein FtsQ
VSRKKAVRQKSEPGFGTAAMIRFNGMSEQFTKLMKFSSSNSGKGKKTSRRKPAPGWRKPALIGGGVIIAAIIVGGVSNFMSEQKVIDQISHWIDDQQQALASGLGLTVQEISVVGRERTAAEDILRALDVERGESILAVDPNEARKRLETLGWIESASIMRLFPDELFIEIKERRPFARWQFHGQTGVIDRSGALVSKNEADKFNHLPKVVGDGANEHAAELFDMLSQTPKLFTRLKNAIRIRDRRWNLEFDDKVTVMLPESGAGKAWKQLDRMQQEKQVLNQELVAIDLRATDRMYVRLKPKDAALRREDGNET